MARRLPRASLAVGVVAFVAGVLFATNASVFAAQDTSRPNDLRGLVAQETERLDTRNAEVEELRAEVAQFEEDTAVAPAAPSAAEALETGLEALTGPGVRVSLSDAPSGATSQNPDDLVVHQQDIQAVVNALWAGGADAVAIQGQRVVATTAVRCVGNVLLLHGRTYSPPYVVEAIGDVDELTQALERDPVLEVYQQYVDAFGLGWSVQERDEITLDAYTGTRTLSHASLLTDGDGPA